MKSSRQSVTRRPSIQKSRRTSFLQGGRQRRRLFAEQLETRVLLAGDLTNWDNPYDTDANGVFSPADILHVINQLNADSASRGAAGEAAHYFNDVNADGTVSPIDALHGINEFTRRAEGEGDQLVRVRITTVTPGTNTPIAGSVPKGTDYELRVTLEDLRNPANEGADPGPEDDIPPGPPDGVYGNWLDYLYNRNVTNVEIDEIQNITINNNPSGGTFTLTFNGQTTGNINYDLSDPVDPQAAIRVNIKNALDAKFGADRFDVTAVSAGDPARYRIRFMGAFGDQDVGLITGNPSGLISSGTAPTITVVETLKGVYSPASFLESFRFNPVYLSGRTALDGPSLPSDPHRLNEVGAFGTGTQFLGPQIRELFRVRMNTLDAGTVSFTASAVDMVRPAHDTLIFGGTSDRRILPSEIDIVNPTPFTVTEPFSANPDTFNFGEDGGVKTLNVKSNDTGALTGVTIQSISTTSLSVGNLAIAAGNNSITFTPIANANGTATFTYTLSNGTVTDKTTVTINVSAVNDSPVNTVPGAQTTAEENAKVISGISIADIDAAETAGANMQVELTVTNGRIDLASVTGLTFTGGGNGTANMTVQGSLTDINAALSGLSYTPVQDYAGSDSLLIETDDLGNTGTPGPLSDTDSISITVTPVNDAPVLTLPGDTSILEGDPLTITGTSVADVDAAAGIIKMSMNVTGDGALTLGSTSGITFISGTANGQSSIVFTGTLANVNAAIASFTYLPPLGDAGTQTLSVTVDDQGNTGGGSLTASGEIIIDVIPLVRPFARRDPTPANAASQAAFTVAEGSSNTALPVLDNDLVDDPVSPATVTDKILLSVADPPHGTTSVSGDLVIYTPDADFWGTDTFTYVMNQDTNGDAAVDGADSTGTTTVTITNVNDAPVASSFADVTDEDIAKDIVLAVSDLDNNNNTGFVSTLTPTVVSPPSNGTATVNANGTIRYTPALNFNGSDTLTYRVTDETGLQSGVETITITVNAVNDAPVAAAGTLVTAEDTAATGTLVATDVEGSPLTYSLVSDANAHGTVTITNASTGAYSYSPDLDYDGSAGPASFTFKANDGSLDSNVATVAITVTPTNDAPVAVDDVAATAEDTAVTLTQANLKGNDTDVDNTNAQLSVSAVSGAVNGSVVLNANGTITFTPAADFNGTAGFDYTLSDGSLTDTGHVTVNVTAVNDAPVAVNGTLSVTEDIAATGTLVATDIDSPTLTYSLVSTVNAHGTVTITNSNTGAYSYSPDANYNGAASFTFKVNDGIADSNVATVAITIAEVNDPPTANDDGTPVRITMIKNFDDQEINVLLNDSNAPDFNVVENLTIIRVAGSSTVGTTALGNHVRISADGKKVIFDEDAGIEASDQFTYTISDGRGGEATATVFVEVVNFIPTDVTGTVYIDSNNSGQVDVGEKRLAGVKLTLQGHDNIFNIDFGADTDNNPANDTAALVVFTDVNGNYSFDAPNSQRPGMRPGTYTITQHQPEFLRDGIDTAGANAQLLANDRFGFTLPLLGFANGAGGNFGERGLNPAYVSINDILASSTGNGLILATDASGDTQLWQLQLAGWANLKACSCTLSSDTSTATFTFTDNGNNVYTRTVAQIGNPRFRLMGRDGDGNVLIRLDGTAADFGLTLAAAGNQGQQPEGEADPEAGAYARGVDALMAQVGTA